MSSIMDSRLTKVLHKHPYKTFIPQNATKLLLGSIPPAQFTVKNGKLREGDLEFYCGSRDNALWPLLAKISGATLDTVEERKRFLSDHGIAISDIVESCTRKNDIGALDTDLKDIMYRDLSEIWNHRITDVYCTSGWVFERFKKYYEIPSSVKVHCLPSPSRSYFRSAKRMKIYQAALEQDPNLTPAEFRINCYKALLS